MREIVGSGYDLGCIKGEYIYRARGTRRAKLFGGAGRFLQGSKAGIHVGNMTIRQLLELADS